MDAHEGVRINICIALCRRQALMTEELLNGAQVAAPGQQVRGEAVPQGVRGGGFREA